MPRPHREWRNDAPSLACPRARESPSLYEFMASAIQARRQRVENDVPADLVVQANSNMLNEVFENLLSNAVKYGREEDHSTDRESGERGIPLRRPQRRGGITAEQKGRLFGKFSRSSG